jgi:glycerate dehydrogenase
MATGYHHGRELSVNKRLDTLASPPLDVISEEPPSPRHPVIKAAKELDNLLVTPHCAWTAHETRQRLMDEVAENIAAFQRGKEKNRVV